MKNTLQDLERRLSIIAVVILVAGALLSTPMAGTILAQKRLSEFSDRPPPPVSAETRRAMEAQLDEARTRYEAKPNDPQAIIWLGRRLAYLGRFREAIEVYSEGIKKFPWHARFYRHRGHRYVTLRRFDLAIVDLKRAADLIKGKPDEVEPDGQPNVRNIPTSTLHFNIWYHLGLAHYLKGRNQQALKSYRECLKVSNSPDRLVATTHWLYMTLRRMKRDGEAVQSLEPIREGMEVIENGSYYQLLKMYKGIISPDDLLKETLNQDSSAASHSLLYGIGNWYLYNSRPDDARQVFRPMLAGNQWTSFGYIAAEADMKRLGN